jgi:hypothetical protein
MYEVWSPTQRISFVHGSLAVRKRHRIDERLEVPQGTCLPLVQHVVRLPEQMSQCVVRESYDEELRASFKVTPPILNRFSCGQ